MIIIYGTPDTYRPSVQGCIENNKAPGLWFLIVSLFVILLNYIIRIRVCQPFSSTFGYFFATFLEIIYHDLRLASIVVLRAFSAFAHERGFLPWHHLKPELLIEFRHLRRKPDPLCSKPSGFHRHRFHKFPAISHSLELLLHGNTAKDIFIRSTT